MAKRYSIADARNQLAQVVHQAEDGSLIELTRRGKPVAVVLSLEAYRRITAERPSPWTVIKAFRENNDMDELDIDPDVLFERSNETGRDFSW